MSSDHTEIVNSEHFNAETGFYKYEQYSVYS